jgi:hypothetical protein
MPMRCLLGASTQGIALQCSAVQCSAVHPTDACLRVENQLGLRPQHIPQEGQQRRQALRRLAEGVENGLHQQQGGLRMRQTVPRGPFAASLACWGGEVQVVALGGLLGNNL